MNAVNLFHLNVFWLNDPSTPLGSLLFTNASWQGNAWTYLPESDNPFGDVETGHIHPDAYGLVLHDDHCEAVGSLFPFNPATAQLHDGGSLYVRGTEYHWEMAWIDVLGRQSPEQVEALLRFRLRAANV